MFKKRRIDMLCGMVGFVFMWQLVVNVAFGEEGKAKVRPWGVDLIRAPVAAIKAESMYTNDYATATYQDAWDFEEGDMEGIKEFGPGIKDSKLVDGKLMFTTSASNNWFYWGPEEKIGWNWNEGFPEGYVFYLLITLKQSFSNSVWKIFGHVPAAAGSFPHLANIKIEGKGPKTHYIQLNTTGGWSIMGARDTFSLECLTPGNRVEIDDVRLMQKTKPLYFRKEFVLDETAEKADLWIWANGDCFRIYVNGREIYQDLQRLNGLLPTRVMDVTGKLRKGTNVLGVVHDMVAYHGSDYTDLAGRLFITLKSGRQLDIKTDGSWLAASELTPNWNTVEWKGQGFTNCVGLGDVVTVKGKGHNNVEDILTAGGINTILPYVGPIEMQTGPYGRGLIFDAAKGIVGNVLVRGRWENQALTYGLRQTYPGQAVASGGVSRSGKETNPACYNMNIPVKEPGTYLLTLKLMEGTNCVSERIEEVAAVGEIKQPEAEGSSLTNGMELALIDEVKCGDSKDAHPFNDSGLCMDQNKPSSRIEELPGIGKVRFTGEVDYHCSKTGQQVSWFAYQVKFGRSNQPHMIEVEYPDSNRQVMLVQVNEYPGDLNPAEALVKPARRSQGRLIWSFASGGNDYPGAGKLVRERFVVFPGNAWGTVMIANGNMDGGSPAVSAIRVYEVVNNLPKLKVNNVVEGRLMGSWAEATTRIIPTFLNGTPGPIRDNYFASGFRSEIWFQEWYRTIENLIKWLRFSGQNTFYLGVYMYNNGLYPINGQLNNSFCSEDYNALFARMFEKNNLNLVLGVEFVSTHALNERERRISMKEIKTGADTTSEIDRRGRRARFFSFNLLNSLHPEVQKEMVRIAGTMADLYKEFPAVKGVCFSAGYFGHGGATTTPLATHRLWDPLSSSYDDTSIRLFEEATGIKMPVGKTDPERFAKRYDYIMKNCAKEWIAFRCQAIAALCGRISGAVRQANPKMETFFDWANTYYNDWFGGEIDLRDYFRRMGVDFSLMPENVISGVNHVFAPERYFYARPGPEAQRAFQNETLGEWFGMKKSCLGIQTHWYEWGWVDDVPAISNRPNPKPWYWVGGAHQDGDVKVCERYFGEPFAAAFSWGTPEAIYFGQTDLTGPGGGEAGTRAFARAYYTLPRVTYTTLRGNGLDRNLVVRGCEWDGQTYVYVLNPLPFEVEATLDAGQKQITDLISDKAVTANTLSLALGPYEMRTFRGKGVLFAGAKVTVSAQSDRFIQRWRELAKKTQASEDKEIKALGQKLSQLLTETDYVAARKLVESREMATFMKVQAPRIPRKVATPAGKAREEKAVWRVDCGIYSSYTDKAGNQWQADQDYMNVETKGYGYVGGGGVADRGKGQKVKGTEDERIYQTERWGMDGYRFQVPDGKYTVKLHFAETSAPGRGRRVFAVFAQGQERLIVDIYKEAGTDTALVKTLDGVMVSDGELKLDFVGVAGQGCQCVQGVEVIRTSEL